MLEAKAGKEEAKGVRKQQLLLCVVIVLPSHRAARCGRSLPL